MVLSRACAVAFALVASLAHAQSTSVRLLGALETELVYSPASYRVGEAVRSGNAVRYSGWAPSYLRAGAAWYPNDLFIGAFADAHFETFVLNGPGFTPGEELDDRVAAGQLGAGVTARFALSSQLSFGARAGFALQTLPFGTYDPTTTSGVRTLSIGFLGPTLGGAARWSSGPWAAEVRASLLPFSVIGGALGQSGSGRAFSLAVQGHLGRFALGTFDLQPVAGYELTAAVGTAPTLAASQAAHRFYLGARALFGALRANRIPTGPGWIRGQVLSADGAPVPGAEVRLGDSGEQALTDATGAFRFERVLPGPHVLEVSAPGFRAASETVEIAPESERVAALRLERKTGPGRITGRVLGRTEDGTAGPPLVGAQVEGPDANLVVTDSEGRFVLEGMGPGLVTVYVRSSGHQEVEEVVSVPPEADAELEVLLAPQKVRTLASLRGRVRSVAGKPIAATIKIPEARVTTRAGKDGRFVVRLPGGRYSVVFSAPGFITQTKPVQVADGDQALFYVDLSPEER